MQNLENKINKMLDGEQKRRETALKFIDKICDMFTPESVKMLSEFTFDDAFEIASGAFIYCNCDNEIEIKINTIDNEFHDRFCDDLRFVKNIEEVKGVIFWQYLQKIIDNKQVIFDKIAKYEAYANSVVEELENV